MAEVSLELGQDDRNENVNLTFEAADGNVPLSLEDDYDFELDDGEGLKEPQDTDLWGDVFPEGSDPARDLHNARTEEKSPTGDSGSLSKSAPVEQVPTGGDDEIDYEDDLLDQNQLPTATLAVDSVATGTAAQSQSGHGAEEVDEIDYDDDIDFTKLGKGDGGTGQSQTYEQEPPTSGIHRGVGQPHGDLDFDVVETFGLPGTEASEATEFGAFQELSDSHEAHGLIEPDDEAPSGESVSPTNGIAQESESFTSTLPNVTVTWGDEICPLFRTSELDEPNTFYLEDLKAADGNLSAFLANIRRAISTWIKEEDEIQIRVKELQLEFGETTSNDFLEKVTFNYVLMTYYKLLENDGLSTSQGLNLILTTRPNCVVRFTNLTKGFQAGQGLSAFQVGAGSGEYLANADYSGSVSQNGSSADELFEGASTGSYADEQPSADVQEGAELHQMTTLDTEGLDAASDEQPAAVSPNDVKSTGGRASESPEDLIDYDDDAPEEDLAEDDIDHSAQEDTDLVDYSNDYDHAEDLGVGGQEYEGSAHLQIADTEAHGGYQGEHANLDQSNATEDDLLNYEEHWDAEFDGDDLDNDAAVSLDEFSQDGAELHIPVGGAEVASVSAPHGQEQDDDESPNDELVDFGLGEQISLPTVVGDGQNNASHQTSATTTIAGDEIDYEEDAPSTPGAGPSHENGLASNPPRSDASNAPPPVDDELIDWDDEDKMIAPAANLSPSNSITGKRSREMDDAEGLADDGHDTKRHRPEQAQA